MTTPVLTGNQFSQALADAQVRQVQIIHIGLGAGVLVFAAIILVLHPITEVAQPEPGSDGMLRAWSASSSTRFSAAATEPALEG